MSKLLSSLPVGSLVKDTSFTYKGTTPIFRVLEHGHSGDPSGTTALEFRDIIHLKAFDAKEPKNSDSNRKNYGNNRYLYSNLLQWLNSSGAANSWYSAQHSADQSPNSTSVVSVNAYASEAGFLTFFPTELKNALQSVSKKTVKCSVDGGGSENVTSKIFLLSRTEVGLGDENNIAEGSIYSYYATDGAKRRKKNLASAAAAGDASDIPSPWYWWLRTPYYYASNSACVVGDGGSLSYLTANEGYEGVAPAFCVPQTTKVSYDVDSDGAYTLLI